MSPGQRTLRFEVSAFNNIKPQPREPETGKTDFLFIVKTPSSEALSRSTTRSAAASINSHAQKWAQEASGGVNANNDDRGDTTNTATTTVSSAATGMLHFKDCLTRCRVDRLLVDEKKSRSRTRRRSTPNTNRSRAGAGQSVAKRRKVSSTLAPSGLPCTVNGKFVTDKTSHHSTAPSASDGGDSGSLPGPREPTSSPMSVSTSTTSFSTPLPNSGPLLHYTSLPLRLPVDKNKDGDVQPVLEYYLSFVLLSTPDGRDLSSADAGLYRHRSSIDAIVQGCMRETVHLYALLAATASRMKRVSGVAFRGDSGPEFYLHKAIQGLRAMLNGPSILEDRQLILDIYYLSVCSWYLGSHEASKTHFNILKHFWKSLVPGRSPLDQYIYDMLNYNAKFLTSDGATSAAPARAVQTAEPGLIMGINREPAARPEEEGGDVSRPSSACMPGRLSSYRECSAFSSALHPSVYSEELRNVVGDLPPLVELHEYLRQTPHPPPIEIERLRGKSQALTMRLLQDPSYGTELCCRLALVLLLDHIHRHPCSTELRNHVVFSEKEGLQPGEGSLAREDFGVDTRLITKRLKRQLQYEILLPFNLIPVKIPETIAPLPHPCTPLPPPVRPADPLDLDSGPSPSHASGTNIWTGKDDPLLLWILTTGLWAARQCRLDDEYRWFAARVVPLIRLLNIGTLEQLDQLLGSFVRVDELLQDPLFARTSPCFTCEIGAD